MAGLDHSPPPFFKRGPAPFALLSLYLATAISLMVLDHRFHYLGLLRQVVAVIAQPLQMLAQGPGRLIEHAGNYVTTVDSLQRENDQLRRRQLDASLSLNRQYQLESENERLRKLLNMKEREQGKGQVAQLLYAARDPFSRRVVVDRGQQHDVEAGLPVVDDLGVVGQVTRVFPLLSEVTLITDKDQAIPVQVVRNGLRSVVFGLGNGQLELRYMPANADVQNGDLLVTSGLDGIFLPGLPVAKVVHIERDTAYSFARIYCAPVAGVEHFGELIILNQRVALPPAPPEAARRDDSPVSGRRRRK